MIKDIVDENAKKDINAEKIAKLKEIIPNCFDKNGRLDTELLKEEFNDDLDYTKESYELNFLGKTYAKMIAGLDTETVIEPDTEHNEKEENKNSENIYISGDNLDALKHLVKAKGYEGHIKCIYIDPPYNTGSDGFVYKDKFKYDKESLMEQLDIDENEAERILNMTSGNSSTHSAWLTFMYPRLYLAKQLLSDDGVIFISIDDNELADLKLLCDSIFGEENFENFVWKKKGGASNTETVVGCLTEHILCYFKEKKAGDFNYKNFDRIFKYEDENGKYNLEGIEKTNLGQYARPTMLFEIEDPNTGEKFLPSPNMRWTIGKEKIKEKINSGKIYFDYDKRKVYVKKYKEDYDVSENIYYNLFENCGSLSTAKDELDELFQNRELFSTPKPTNLLKQLLEISTKSDSIILDFFSGSASMAQAVMQLNAEDGGCRKYIMVQLPEKTKENSQAQESGYNTIDEIGQERIKRAAKKIKEETGADIDYGFKHYTLKDTPEDLLHKMEEFNPDLLINESIDLYKEYGIETILETWKLRDGYKFTDPVEKVDLDGYTAYRCGECIYFIEPHIEIDNINALLQKYSSEEDFTCNKVVIFGYSFMFNELEMIKNNIKQVKNTTNIDVRAYTRY